MPKKLASASSRSCGFNRWFDADDCQRWFRARDGHESRSRYIYDHRERTAERNTGIRIEALRIRAFRAEVLAATTTAASCSAQ